MKIHKIYKLIISALITILGSYGILQARNGLQAEPGDTLTASKWNELVEETNSKLVPSGFAKTNGIIHTINEQNAVNHYSAIINCVSKESHICQAHEYKLAGLGSNFGSNFTGADSQLWWDGNITYNHINNCLNKSCSVGGALEAGVSDGGSYLKYNLTTCDDRCNRTLKYYCCY